MRKFFLIFAVLLLLQSCGSTTVYQLQTNCEMGREELFKNITSLLVKENFVIKKYDENIGYLQAGTIPIVRSWSGAVMRVWVFQYDGKILTASARELSNWVDTEGEGIWGKEEYFDDHTNHEYAWYWNVRNGLEKLCGNKIKITGREVN